LGADAALDAGTESATPATDDETLPALSLPRMCEKKVSAALDADYESW